MTILGLPDIFMVQNVESTYAGHTDRDKININKDCEENKIRAHFRRRN